MRSKRTVKDKTVVRRPLRAHIPEEIAYLVAILLMAVGVGLTERAGMGLSMIVAPAYILSAVTGLGFGTMEYIVQAALLVLLCILLRRFRIAYLFSFITAFIYGLVLDGALLLFAHLPAEGPVLRILWFILGALVTAVAVALFFRVYPSPEAYDLFVREVSRAFGLPGGRFKLGYDLTSFAVSVVLSFLFFGFGSFYGIGIGTVVLAFLNGPLISGAGALLDRYTVFYPLLPIKKHFC